MQSRFRLERLGERLGYSIPPGVFGPGLRIAHPGTIVVNPQVVVGSGCTVHQGVTLGSSGGLVPKVGSNVWIGPGAQIFGGIRIGDGAVIGANAVVNRDVPRGAFMAGVPARVVGQAVDLGNAPIALQNIDE
ncbi:serine O-acetyltransferase [Arthrobacter sp. TS-15]|uniref:serine O-acetyltransferase n=1 Tax=Arthrobacter sp. TS-15 TaxID=2510797 RepID=UPI00135CCA80|nr:DapH/DapD/GlmU-related protein [Arthrobacter sp. TS-15]